MWSYETGVKAKAWDGRAVIDLDAFWIDWTDTQTLIAAVVGQPYLVNGNGGAAVSKGLEGQVTLLPAQGLTVIGGAAYTDAHFTETVTGSSSAGGQLEFSAKFTASLQAEYERELSGDWRGFVGGDYRYRSTMLDAVNVRMPEYGQFGLHAGVENGPLRINAFVTNLTDKRGLLGYTGGGNQVGDPYRYAVSPPAPSASP